MDNIVMMTIPIGRTGGVFLEIDPTKAVSGPVQMQRKLLVVGQRLSAGTTPALAPVQVVNAEDAAIQFGRGSSMHLMFLGLDAVQKMYGMLDTWAVAMDDLAAGVAAKGTFTLTGTVTQATTMTVYVAGRPVSVLASVGDTAATLAAKITAEINAHSLLPVSAVADTNVITVTCYHKGEIGNGLELSTETDGATQQMPIGVSVACVNLSGGTGNPDVATALSSVADDWFYSIVAPYTDSVNLAAMELDMVERFGGMNMQTGHIFNARDSTMAGLTTWGATRNSPHMSTWGQNVSPMWAPERLAIFAGVCEYASQIHVSQPLRNLELPGVIPPRPKHRFKRKERELLLKDGISSTFVTPSGKVFLERVITNYQKNPQGFDDESLLRLETKWQVDYYRFAHASNIARRHPRDILVDDDANISPDLPHVKPKTLGAECYALDLELEKLGIIENAAQNKSKYRFMRSAVDKDRVNAILPPNMANQFVTFAAAVQYQL